MSTDSPTADVAPQTDATTQTESTLHFAVRDSVGFITLDRPRKRNALDDATVAELGRLVTELPSEVAAVVLHATGEHFSAGLDLSELSERDAVAGLHHSRSWHRTMNAIADSEVPVIAAVHGGVIGGGLELASAAHLRVADETAYFALPEGKRGLFVGGGASVRVPRLIGLTRVQDMMLTGRRFNAAEAEAIGLVNYRVATGEALNKATELAASIATNSPVTNYAVTQALPRIVESGRDEGYMMESLMASVAQSSAEAKGLMRDFLAGTGPKVTK